MKAIVVVPEEKFNNKEYNTVIHTLQKNQIDYEVASPSGKMATGYISKEYNNKPMLIIPDISIEEINIEDCKCIIIIGGSGNKKYLWKNTTLHNKLKNAYEKGVLIAAICLAPICLIYSEIIKSVKISAYKTKETLEIIKNSGNYFSDEEVCVYENIITANGPRASVLFSERIISLLIEGN